jgi:hypothetical protein
LIKTRLWKVILYYLINHVIEINGIVIVDYEIIKRINYLIDYSQFLIKNNKYDEKIMNWQVENLMLLRPLGLDYNFLKKKMDENNLRYYKYDVFINQISCMEGI